MFKNRSFYLFVVFLFVTACAPQATATTQATPEPVATAHQASPIPGAETERWSEGPFPNGTWTAEWSIEDLVGMGMPESDAAGWAGVGTLIFQEGNVVYQHEGGFEYECEGTYEAVEDFVRITYADSPAGVCNGVVEDVRWRLDDDGIHFQLMAAMNTPYDLDKVSWEAKPWQKVSDP